MSDDPEASNIVIIDQFSELPEFFAKGKDLDYKQLADLLAVVRIRKYEKAMFPVRVSSRIAFLWVQLDGDLDFLLDNVKEDPMLSREEAMRGAIEFERALKDHRHIAGWVMI